MYLQNLMGNHPLRWEHTGVVIEVKPFNQYVIRVDGSGRVTLRNRRHLRKFTPFVKKCNILSTQIPLIPTHPIEPSKSSTVTSSGPSPNPQSESMTSEVGNVPLATPEQSATPDDHLPQPPTVESDDNSTHSDILNNPEIEHPQQKKLPLAMRRLLAHNKSGRKEF